METEDDLKKFYALIGSVQIAMLTTVDESGGLRSRPMAMLESDGRDLWFFTRLDASKVLEVAHDRQVNLAYADPGDNRYVSVSGVAQVVRDRAKIRKLWKPAYKAFFPEGMDDPNLALLKVTAHEAEYWTGPTNWFGKLLRFAVAAIKGDERALGDHEKLQLT
jgi:general stress protein 26